MEMSTWFTQRLNERGWTRNQLADVLGVSVAAINKWVTRRGMPDTRYVPRIAAAFGVPPIEVWRFYAGQTTEPDMIDFYVLRLADVVPIPPDATQEDLRFYLHLLREISAPLMTVYSDYRTKRLGELAETARSLRQREDEQIRLVPESSTTGSTDDGNGNHDTPRRRSRRKNA